MTTQDPRTKFPKPGKDESPQTYPGLETDMNIKPDYGKDSYKGSGRLKEKVAIVTGGDSGIGRAVALAFAREGADIVLAYLPEEEEDAKEIVADIQATGKKVLTLPGDLADDTYCEQLIQQTHEAFGRIDILVNNAGLQKHFDSMNDIQTNDFLNIYRINVVAPFLLTKLVAKFMQPGGSIINTISIQGYKPSARLLPYAASKGALIALTKANAEELLEKGIRVNGVAPGPIWSPLNTHGSSPERLKKFGESSALGRPGQPVELSPVYVLLASDEASYITGEIYGITGGKGIA